MSERSTDELLAAFVDGIGELTADERRRVEARLADDPALRDDALATRALLGQLRELPDEGADPDWSAMAHAIRAEVGPGVPRPWWRGWRWLVPVGALASAGAVLALVLRAPEPVTPAPVTPAPVSVHVPEAGVLVAAPGVAAPGVVAEDTVPLWLDGAAIEVDLRAAELLTDEPTAGDDDEVGLLPAGELAWVDDLGDDDIAAAEAWLARKKS